MLLLCCSQVPTVGQVVTAAVRSEELGTVTKRMEEISIPPKPVVMHQDVSSCRLPISTAGTDHNGYRAMIKVIQIA